MSVSLSHIYMEMVSYEIDFLACFTHDPRYLTPLLLDKCYVSKKVCDTQIRKSATSLGLVFRNQIEYVTFSGKFRKKLKGALKELARVWLVERSVEVEDDGHKKVYKTKDPFP